MSPDQLPPTSNAARGAAFEVEVAALLAAHYDQRVDTSVALPIGQPPQTHNFDLALRDRSVVVECKAFTWTSTGNVPSAKITTLREAILYLSWLPADTKKVIAMRHSVRATHGESLGSYFVQLNGHLLGDIAVVEVDGSNLRVLRGTL